MHRDQVLQLLRDHEAELKAAGLIHLHLFGSVARGEETSESDVDLLAEFDPTRRRNLVTMGSLHSQLTDLLGRDVDLCSTDTLHVPIRNRALEEAVVAF